MTAPQKRLIKALTFWIAPKFLKKQAVCRLQYLLGLSPLKPATLCEQYAYLRAKRQFISRNRNLDIFTCRIVSLGNSCLSRTLPTQWGLKPRKNQGEPSYPFDLSVNTLPAVVKYLSNDFSGYFDDLYFDSAVKVWKNRTDGTIYNHDLDCSAADKAKFMARFELRINNLRHILEQDSKPAIFISHYNINTPTAADETYRLYDKLYRTLAAKRQNRAFKLLIVDLSGTLNAARLPPEVILCAYPHLPPSYVWYTDEHRRTKAGLSFELNLAQTLLNLIKQLSS